MSEVIEPLINDLLVDLIWRIAWFGDTEAENVSDGGSITNGVDTDLITVADGLWKHIYAQVAINGAQRTAITTNTKAAMTAQGAATSLIDQMIIDAGPEIMTKSGKVIYMTQAMATAFDIDLRKTNCCNLPWDQVTEGISTTLYINEADLVPVSRPIMRAKYGYSLGLRVGSTWHWCPIMPEGYTFLADKIAGGRLTLYVSGYLNIEMAVDDNLYLAIGTTRNGIFDPNAAGDIHVQGGPLYIAEIIGKENEVQPDQMFPVEGNLPDIKPIDLVKFLAAVTGVFPTQASTTDTLVMCPVASYSS